MQGVIDFYGASDVLTMPPNVPGPDKTDADLAKSNAARLIGGIVRDHPDLAKQMSPLYHVNERQSAVPDHPRRQGQIRCRLNKANGCTPS